LIFMNLVYNCHIFDNLEMALSYFGPKLIDKKIKLP